MDLRDVVVVIKNQIQDFVDIPDSLIENTKENDKLFQLIIDTVIIISDLISHIMLSETKIVELIKEFNNKISHIMFTTTNRHKIKDILEYVHGKIDDAKELSIAFQLYETAENIRKFNTIDIYDLEVVN